VRSQEVVYELCFLTVSHFFYIEGAARAGSTFLLELAILLGVASCRVGDEVALVLLGSYLQEDTANTGVGCKVAATQSSCSTRSTQLVPAKWMHTRI
jgi:hypothetical protein